MADWQPGASPEILRLRAEMLAKIRQFFADRNVLEVETPLLARTTATDVYIDSFEVAPPLAGEIENFFLQTSPEYCMKRLLASGSGAIYQICKSFRRGESSRRHNPEFTMLEWYRPDYSMKSLMDEVESLIRQLLNCEAIPRVSYRDLFQQQLQLDPHKIELDELRTIARSRLDIASDPLSRTDYLQLLLAQCIEPLMPPQCFVFDFPVAQAALATIAEDESATPVAKRFELFCGGVELANGYFELTDAVEQRARFEADLEARRMLKLPAYPIDEKLLAAMEQGLPSCAGVALGVDRLVMLAYGVANISEAMSFTTDRT